jgi:Fe-S oxidoreductase
VSACPWCEANLGDAIDAMESKLKVYNILELVEQVME